jgi:hypothetical protein
VEWGRVECQDQRAKPTSGSVGDNRLSIPVQFPASFVARCGSTKVVQVYVARRLAKADLWVQDIWSRDQSVTKAVRVGQKPAW